MKRKRDCPITTLCRGWGDNPSYAVEVRHFDFSIGAACTHSSKRHDPGFQGRRNQLQEISGTYSDQEWISSRALMERFLHLHIFDKAPRCLPPYVEHFMQGASTEGAKHLDDATLVRAVRRGALLPWRDARFWRRAADAVAKKEMAGRDLAQVCLAFRRVDFPSRILSQHCLSYVTSASPTFNTFELSAVLAYFSSAGAGLPGAEDFICKIADEAVAPWRQRETVPWSAWKMLVTASAEAGVDHQLLFTTAAPHLARNVKYMNGRDAVDVCGAFAEFRFKHNALLAELARFLPAMGLSDAEVAAMQGSFQRLDFDAPMLRRLQQLKGT
eukprot:s2927_g14.t1